MPDGISKRSSPATGRLGDRRLLDVRAWPLVSREAVSPLLLVGGAVVIAAAVRVWLARKVVTPWIMIDELVYSELAKSFADTGHYLLRGQPTATWSVVYPALISPAWLARPMSTTYGIAKAINAVAMTSTAVPLFLWGARLASRRYALLAAGLLLLIPSYYYTAMLMTENLFLPAFFLATFVIARALERPTVLRQLAALCGIGFAVAVRFQGLILLVILPTAVLLKVALDATAERGVPWRARLASLVRWWPTAVIGLVGAAAYVIWKRAHGAPLGTGVGAYQTVFSSGYSVSNVARWVLYHFAELPLAFAFVPASAFLLLFVVALGRGVVDEGERSFLAVTAAATFWVVLEVAAFASRFSLRVEERYMFALAPLFLLAFVVWLARGLPRPPLPTAIAAAVPALLLLALPLGRLLNISILSDTFGLIPFLRLSGRLGSVSDARAFLLVGGAAAALAFALLPRRQAVVALPAAMVGFLVLSSYSVHGAIRDYARGLRDSAGLGGNAGWIDSADGGKRAAFLFTGRVDPHQESSVLWQAEFWNRSIEDYYDLDVPEPVPLGSTLVTTQRGNGRLTAAGATPLSQDSYVVTESSVELAGRRVAARGPLALYRVTRPLRLASLVEGVYGDGWTGADASFTRFVPPTAPARVVVSLSRTNWRGPDVPGRVRISLRAGRKLLASSTWVAHSGKARSFRLRAPRRPFVIDVHVSPTFTPSRFGLPDSRQLGVQAGFRMVRAVGGR